MQGSVKIFKQSKQEKWSDMEKKLFVSAEDGLRTSHVLWFNSKILGMQIVDLIK